MVISIWRKRRSDTLLGYRNPQAEIVHLLFPVSLIGLTYGREMSYTHGRDITLEGWLVHTSQANVKGTIKEHRNPILESRCKSKRGMKSELVPTNQSKLTLPPLSSYIKKKGDDLISHPLFHMRSARALYFASMQYTYIRSL